MTPRVSLSLPVYNGEPYLEQAIRSILEQDFTDFELVITDNASTDRTEEICRGFAGQDRRIRYLRNARNLGAAANFNLGFANTGGEYFKWCAADDLLSPNYLGECVRALDANPRAAVAYGKLVEIDERGAETSAVEPSIPSLQHLAEAERLRALLPEHVLVGAIFGLYRRSALSRTALHQPYYSSDCALLSEIVLLGEVLHLPEASLFNREHPTRSVNLSTSARLLWQDPGATGVNSFELSRRIAHLYSMAYRHRGSAPLHRTWLYITLWAMRPIHVGRMALEAIGAVSPSSRRRLRGAGLRLLGLLEGARRRSA
jgi:glycosyltransferase involved in cell wall biosynthesis